MIKQPQFYWIFVMNVLSILNGILITHSGKTWGEEKFDNDELLSGVVAIGSIFGALRFFWSFLMDKYSYKRVYSVMIFIMMINAFCLPIVMEIKNEKFKQVLFTICLCVAYNIEGGHFVVMPTALAKLFGPDGGFRTFAIGFGFFSVASIINGLMINKFLDHTGWIELGFGGICYIYFGCAAVSLVLISLFKENKVVIE